MNEPADNASRRRILVIKHGALGDFFLAMAPFAAIRTHHLDDKIVLLTTRPYSDLARISPYFDEIWVDDRPRWYDVNGIARLRRRLRAAGFARVYDLQTSRRSSAYYRLFDSPKPEWSGIAKSCSHPHRNPGRDDMHTVDRQREQLADAGIEAAGEADLAWLDDDVSGFQLPPRFVLLVPGGALHRPKKRWSASAFAELAKKLRREGLEIVLIGAEADRAPIRSIADQLPTTIDLTGATSFGQIAALARRAAGAVGNDTGPMHLIATVGCPSVVLFSAASDPALCAPRGPNVKIVAVEDLAMLASGDVWSALELR